MPFALHTRCHCGTIRRRRTDMEKPDPALLIKTARKARFWSVRLLARESHLSAGYVSQMESGARPVTPRALGRVADALGVPPYEMLSKGGFIPEGHLDEAKRMAEQALDVPSLYKLALGVTPAAQLDWLIV